MGFDVAEVLQTADKGNHSRNRGAAAMRDSNNGWKRRLEDGTGIRRRLRGATSFGRVGRLHTTACPEKTQKDRHREMATCKVNDPIVDRYRNRPDGGCTKVFQNLLFPHGVTC